jgi:hypothetical protein
MKVRPGLKLTIKHKPSRILRTFCNKGVSVLNSHWVKYPSSFKTLGLEVLHPVFEAKSKGLIKSIREVRHVTIVPVTFSMP